MYEIHVGHGSNTKSRVARHALRLKTTTLSKCEIVFLFYD